MRSEYPFNKSDLIYFKQICGDIETFPSLKKIKKGASSENYILKGKYNRFFIKMPHGNAKQTTQKIIQNILLAQKANLLCPKVIICNHPEILCLEFMQGSSISPRKISPFHLEQLWQEYQKIRTISVPKNTSVNLKKIYNSCQLKLKKKKSFLHNFFISKIQKILSQIPPQELNYKKSKLTTIHGDFHNYNIFFHHNNLSGILDWEELRQGYSSEDWIRFSFCLIERLPNCFQRRKKAKMLFKFLISKRACSKEEWALGFNAFLIYKINKILNKKVSLFRLIKIVLFINFWNKEKENFLEQVEKLS